MAETPIRCPLPEPPPDHPSCLVSRFVAAWADHPHLRLGQLVSAAAASIGHDPFYLYDATLIAAIEALPSPEPPTLPATEPAATPTRDLPGHTADSLNLEEVRRLDSEATEAPWCLQAHDRYVIRTHPVGRVALMDAYRMSDAALIVAMRNALPALLDELERLRSEVARLKPHAIENTVYRPVYEAILKALDIDPQSEIPVPHILDKLERLQGEATRLLNVARGCHDYNGGYHEEPEHGTYHHGIQTVINALELAAKNQPADALQLTVLESIGRASVGSIPTGPTPGYPAGAAGPLPDLAELRRLCAHDSPEPLDYMRLVPVWSAMPALLDELERLRRNNICAVCAGTGQAGASGCICGGSGQSCDEAQGARELCVRLQLAQAHAVDHLRDAIARAAEGDHQPMQSVREALALLGGENA